MIFAKMSGVIGSFLIGADECRRLKPCMAVFTIMLSVGEGKAVKLWTHFTAAATDSAMVLGPVVARCAMYKEK